MQEEISLKEIWNIIKDHIWRIIGSGIVLALIVALVTLFLIDPKYRSTTQLLVNQDTSSNEISYNQIQTSVQLINTYSEIIVSEPILQEALDRMGTSNISVREAQNMISVSNQSNSQIFAIHVDSEDPQYAADFANTLADTFQDNIGDIFDVENVSIISPAQVNTNPVSPNLKLNVAVAFLLGAGLALVVVFVQNAMDTAVKSEEDLEKIGLLLVGKVSAMSDKEVRETRYRRGDQVDSSRQPKALKAETQPTSPSKQRQARSQAQPASRAQAKRASQSKARPKAKTTSQDKTIKQSKQMQADQTPASRSARKEQQGRQVQPASQPRPVPTEPAPTAPVSDQFEPAKEAPTESTRPPASNQADDRRVEDRKVEKQDSQVEDHQEVESRRVENHQEKDRQTDDRPQTKRIRSSRRIN